MQDDTPEKSGSGEDKQALREARRAARQAEREALKAARKAEREAARKAAGAGEGADAGAAPSEAKAAPKKSPADKAGKDAERAARRAEREARKAARQAAGTAQDRGKRGKAAPGRAKSGRPAPDASATQAETTAQVATPATPRTDVASGPSSLSPHPADHPQQDFDILIVAQRGGIDRQAAVLAASLRRNAPGFRGRLIVAEPQPEGAWWGEDTRMSAPARAALTALGAEIRPLVAHRFGRSYPHGNKIEALGLLDPGRPFLFLDSDTLILDEIGAVPFDFARPSASMRREGTWPELPPYGQTYATIWRSLYDRFGLDMDASLDLSQYDEHWERFLYFNAGWFFGADPAEFGRRFADWAVAVRDDPGEALACQSLDPWLDQVVLPLVIHSLGGGRPGPELGGMDGEVTCHYRNLPLLYARGPDAALDAYEAAAARPEIAPLLAGWEPAERLVGGGLGRGRIRPIFADGPAEAPEKTIRQRLKSEDLWLL